MYTTDPNKYSPLSDMGDSHPPIMSLTVSMGMVGGKNADEKEEQDKSS